MLSLLGILRLVRLLLLLSGFCFSATFSEKANWATPQKVAFPVPRLRWRTWIILFMPFNMVCYYMVICVFTAS